jgi:Rrf2 family nitric oxide-sensitive transcriptional repressor
VQLTSYTDYSLRLLIYLMQRPHQVVSTREIAEFYGVSLHHLTKVAKQLTRAGWLVSVRGGNGGLRLAEHTADTKIGDIVRLTENQPLVECFDIRRNTCKISRACRLKGVLYQARSAFFGVLDAYTVRDLARAERAEPQGENQG